MSANVEPEELEAIRGVVEQISTQVFPGRNASAQVEKRNFDEPRRLSAEVLKLLGRRIAATLPATSQALASTLRKNHKLTLAAVSEVNASRLFDGRKSPFLVWCFRLGGQPAWLVWDPRAATHLLSTILSGAHDEEEEPRRFSPSERRVLGSFLTELVRPITSGFEMQPESVCIAQDEQELDAQKEIPAGSDTQRLFVHISWDGPGGSSDLRLYLPGVISAGEGLAQEVSGPIAVPAHVGRVPLDVVAYLGSIDVPLADLLGLEVGDVMPIELAAGEPLEMYVEDRRYATAAWGQRQGRLALKIIEIESRAGTIDQPDS
jgi:flagellar motor switch protein FliM